MQQRGLESTSLGVVVCLVSPDIHVDAMLMGHLSIRWAYETDRLPCFGAVRHKRTYSFMTVA